MAVTGGRGGGWGGGRRRRLNLTDKRKRNWYFNPSQMTVISGLQTET